MIGSTTPIDTSVTSIRDKWKQLIQQVLVQAPFGSWLDFGSQMTFMLFPLWMKLFGPFLFPSLALECFHVPPCTHIIDMESPNNHLKKKLLAEVTATTIKCTILALKVILYTYDLHLEIM